MLPLSPDLVLNAYACGVFPMAERRDDDEVFWIDPEIRGVLPLDRFHMPKRLARTIRSGRFKISANCEFRAVITACAAPNERRPESWINDPIIDVYCELHARGHAHSVECWEDERLVGGLYGVSLGAAFFGESMFSRARDASKVALAHLVARLRAGGFLLLDTQFVTPHLASFGVEEVPRGTYLEWLRQAIAREADYCPPGYSPACGAPAVSPAASGVSAMHSSTQTS